MEHISNFLEQVRIAVADGVTSLMRVISNLPVSCYRCHATYKFGEGKVNLLHDVPEYRGLYFFCEECQDAILAEYCFRCSQCGERHNLANSPLCASCLGERLPQEARRVAKQNARAWRYGAEGTLTTHEWIKTANDFEWKCWRCGAPAQALDHYYPVARGGDTVADNCYPICNKCNSSKGASDPDDEIRQALAILQAHVRVRQYQNQRWPELPAATQNLSAND